MGRRTPRDKTINGESLSGLRRLLIGKRITKAEDDTLTLDDGTRLIIDPNFGGCSCGSGDYWLEHLNDFDNAITEVSIEYDEEKSKLDRCTYERIKIFVFADSDIKDNVITVKGYEGNGYYGRGFEILVQNPKQGEES